MVQFQKLRTVRQIVECSKDRRGRPAITEGGLRWMIFNAARNGLDQALVRVGRRVLIDVSCFVIGPIGDKDADRGSEARTTYENAIQVYEEVIQPACEAVGLEPLRADRLPRAGEIPEQVCQHLRDDEVVIADVSNANPNVMYELGLRHSLPKLTIQIGERERLPFDVHAIRTIKFRRTAGGLIEACRSLEAALAAGLEGEWDPVTATRVWQEAGSDTTEELDEHEAREELGYLEKLANAETAMEELAPIVERLTENMSGLTVLAVAAGERIQTVQNTGGGAAGALAVANKLAEDMAEPTAALEAITAEYGEAMNRVRPGVEVWLEGLEGDPARLPDAEQDLRSFVEMGETAAEAAQAMDGLIGSMEPAAKMSRKLRRVIGRYQNAISRFSDETRILLGWRERILRAQKT